MVRKERNKGENKNYDEVYDKAIKAIEEKDEYNEELKGDVNEDNKDINDDNINDDKIYDDNRDTKVNYNEDSRNMSDSFRDIKNDDNKSINDGNKSINDGNKSINDDNIKDDNKNIKSDDNENTKNDYNKERKNIYNRNIGDENKNIKDDHNKDIKISNKDSDDIKYDNRNTKNNDNENTINLRNTFECIKDLENKENESINLNHNDSRNFSHNNLNNYTNIKNNEDNKNIIEDNGSVEKNIDKKEEDNKNIDKRGKLFLGFWKNNPFYFAIDEYDEPHKKRKIKILKDHPHLSKYYGYSKKTKYISISVAILTVIGWYISQNIKNKILFFIFCYVYGGSLAAIAGIIVHECCHNLAGRTTLENQIIGIIANIAVIIPMSASFKKYHIDHHLYLGVKNKDPDLPLEFEIKLIKSNFFMKIFYLLTYPVYYVGRSLNIKKRINLHEIVNFLVHIGVILTIIKFFNKNAMIYYALSSWLGYSIHPSAAHLIQEHFTFVNGQETYSYYGFLNRFFLNIGYHNEHHDFVAVPWDNLPRIREEAREYYDSLTYFNSWLAVFYTFLTKPMGPHNRVIRYLDTHNRAIKYKID